jgi:hypothetical protein
VRSRIISKNPEIISIALPRKRHKCVHEIISKNPEIISIALKKAGGTRQLFANIA